MTIRSYPRVGLDAFGEVSIINAAQQNVRAKAATTPLFAARQRESEKQHKYAAAAHASRKRQVNIVLEAHGAFGPGLVSVIRFIHNKDKELIKGGQVDEARFARPWCSRAQSAYCAQRISITLRRGAVEMQEHIALAARRHDTNSRRPPRSGAAQQARGPAPAAAAANRTH
jgi:hypothetical protein